MEKVTKFINFLNKIKTAKKNKPVLHERLILGENSRVIGAPRLCIQENASVICGSGVILNSEPIGYHAGMAFPVTLIADRDNAKIVIGNESRLHGCCIHAWKSVIIGKKCLIASGSQILDSNGHTSKLQHARIRSQYSDVPEEIEIGDFSWICLGAIILKGTKIGEGCIVAPYTVVSAKKYPPFSLLAGNPAKVVKRISPEHVFAESYHFGEKLLDNQQKIKW